MNMVLPFRRIKMYAIFMDSYYMFSIIIEFCTFDFNKYFLGVYTSKSGLFISYFVHSINSEKVYPPISR